MILHRIGDMSLLDITLILQFTKSSPGFNQLNNICNGTDITACTYPKEWYVDIFAVGNPFTIYPADQESYDIVAKARITYHMLHCTDIITHDVVVPPYAGIAHILNSKWDMTMQQACSLPLTDNAYQWRHWYTCV